MSCESLDGCEEQACASACEAGGLDATAACLDEDPMCGAEAQDASCQADCYDALATCEANETCDPSCATDFDLCIDAC
jgi:hypothetical protein